jgi:hypothetical protein
VLPPSPGACLRPNSSFVEKLAEALQSSPDDQALQRAGAALFATLARLGDAATLTRLRELGVVRLLVASLEVQHTRMQLSAGSRESQRFPMDGRLAASGAEALKHIALEAVCVSEVCPCSATNIFCHTGCIHGAREHRLCPAARCSQRTEHGSGAVRLRRLAVIMRLGSPQLASLSLVEGNVERLIAQGGALASKLLRGKVGLT